MAVAIGKMDRRVTLVAVSKGDPDADGVAPVKETPVQLWANVVEEPVAESYVDGNTEHSNRRITVTVRYIGEANSCSKIIYRNEAYYVKSTVVLYRDRYTQLIAEL